MNIGSRRDEIAHVLATGNFTEVEAKLKTIGVSVYDINGSMKSWADIFEEIANALDHIK